MHRRLRLAPALLAAPLLLGGPLLPGCQGPQPGVKSAFGSQYALIDAGVEETTEAAVAVFEEMGLREVAASSTEVDAEITGFTADRTRVEAYVAIEEEGRSELSVIVGALGDAATGAEVISRVRAKLGS